jgi:hypothetical protein
MVAGVKGIQMKFNGEEHGVILFEFFVLYFVEADCCQVYFGEFF